VERLGGHFELQHALVVLDLAAWTLAELASRRVPELAGRWLPRLLALVALGLAAGAAAVEAWSRGTGALAAEGLLGLALLVAAWIGRRDTMLWALGGMAVLVYSASWLSNTIVGMEFGRDKVEVAARLGAVGAALVVEMVALAWLLRLGRQRWAEGA
jgi:hypothetical protein